MPYLIVYKSKKSKPKYANCEKSANRKAYKKAEKKALPKNVTAVGVFSRN